MIETPCSPVVIFMTFSQVCGDPVKPGVRQRPAGGVKNVTFWSILTLSRGGRKRSILTPPEPRKVGVTLNQDRWNPPKFTLFSIAPPPQNGVKMTTFWPPLGGGQNRHFGCYRRTSPDSPGIDDVMGVNSEDMYWISPGRTFMLWQVRDERRTITIITWRLQQGLR